MPWFKPPKWTRNQGKKFNMRIKTHLCCKIISLYTINNNCVTVEIIDQYFTYSLKMMPRHTFFEPQPDSASIRTW